MNIGGRGGIRRRGGGGDAQVEGSEDGPRGGCSGHSADGGAVPGGCGAVQSAVAGACVSRNPAGGGCGAFGGGDCVESLAVRSGTGMRRMGRRRDDVLNVRGRSRGVVLGCWSLLWPFLDEAVVVVARASHVEPAFFEDGLGHHGCRVAFPVVKRGRCRRSQRRVLLSRRRNVRGHIQAWRRDNDGPLRRSWYAVDRRRRGAGERDDGNRGGVGIRGRRGRGRAGR